MTQQTENELLAEANDNDLAQPDSSADGIASTMAMNTNSQDKSKMISKTDGIISQSEVDNNAHKSKIISENVQGKLKFIMQSHKNDIPTASIQQTLLIFH